MIRENEGTTAQMQHWVSLADGQIVALIEQQKQLQETLDELQKLRDLTAKTLG